LVLWPRNWGHFFLGQIGQCGFAPTVVTLPPRKLFYFLRGLQSRKSCGYNPPVAVGGNEFEAVYTCVPLYLMLSVGRVIKQGSDRTQL